MKKELLLLVVLLVTAVFLAGCGVLQEPAAPSATLEAIPLATLATATELTERATAVPAQTDTADAAYPAAAATEPPAPATDAYPVDNNTPAPETSANADAYPVEGAPAATSGNQRIYTISAADSEVAFELDEDLRGTRTTVLGVTDQVAGEIALDLNDLAATQVGVIQINARTLATDNDFRNRAIQNEILNTGEFEFITFTPTAVNGLPATAQIGEEITFTIEGGLTVRDVTLPVTFEVVATAVSETQISGVAQATILRSEFGLNIPNVPGVANVEDEVVLTITFLANAG
jgi:polyisoprenoid-binding protein YceI